MENAVDKPEQRTVPADEAQDASAAGAEVIAESGAGGSEATAAVAEDQPAQSGAEPSADESPAASAAADAKDAEVTDAAASGSEPVAPAESDAVAEQSEAEPVVAEERSTGGAATDADAPASGASVETETVTAAVEPTPAAGVQQGERKPHKRVLTGVVVSNGGEQSVVISISQRKQHRLYKKYRTLTKKVMAHDPGDDCQVGDLVRVIESRPLSKMKRWRLVEIVKRAS